MKTIPYKGELTETQTNNIIDWIAALRSGEYQQGQNALHGPVGYCCLGVCSVIQGIKEKDETFYYPNDILLSKLPDENWFKETFGFSFDYQPATYDGRYSTLYSINDSKVSFNHIADIIEASFINRIEIEIPIDNLK